MRIINFVKSAAENAGSAVISAAAKAKQEINIAELPDLEAMTREELEAYLAALEEELDRLDAREPKSQTSEAHEEWEDDHEELEDLIDEVQDILDEMK